LFTASIKSKPSADAFFNRAATKFILKDTCGACNDWRILKFTYLDKDAIKLYQEFCIQKIDTIYYDNNLLPINVSKKYKYYETISYLKCDTIAIGDIHKINHKTTKIYSPVDLMSEGERSDIFAEYILQDKVKYYLFVYSSTFEVDNRNEFEKFEAFFEKYFRSNYDFSKIEYKDQWIKMDLLINNEGNIVSVKIIEDPFKNFDVTLQNQIKSEMIISLKRIPKLIPEKLVHTNVNRKYSIILGLGKKI